MENGKPGYIINGVFHPIPKSEWGKQQFKDDLARYEKARGAEQLRQDSEKVERNKNPNPKPDDPKPDDPKQEQDPPRQDPPKPRQTAQQKAGLPASVPAALVPDVSEYQKARQRAVASGDQKQMDKVRDSGMAIWAKLYGPGGKKELKYPTDRQKEIFKRFPNNTTSQTNSQSSTKQSQGESQNQTEGPQRLQVIPHKEQRQMEPYDLVLEYLLSEGHADTLDEANYIMLKMDSENIQKIVENVQRGPILPG